MLISHISADNLSLISVTSFVVRFGIAIVRFGINKLFRTAVVRSRIRHVHIFKKKKKTLQL